jgi:hypothetical protein
VQVKFFSSLKQTNATLRAQFPNPIPFFLVKRRTSRQVNPVNEFVERQGIKCFVHALDTDDMMRRVQLRINKGEGSDVLGRGLGFFSVIQEVMKVCS